jgi:hypothetical protein
MPSKVWAVGEEVLAADMNDYIQEQVVATFATAAARDAAIPAPNNGQACWLQDALALYVYDGAAWRTFGKGRIASATIGSRDNPPGGNVVHATVTFTLPVARLVEIRAQVSWSCITAAMTGSTSMSVGFDGNSDVRMAAAQNAPANSGYHGSGIVIANLAAGSHTADMKAINASTGGTQRITAGLGHSLSVYDVGGV